MSKYPNLAAEQARNGHTNEFVAKYLNISRSSYEVKKNKGTFKIIECKKLCELYRCKFEYLFNNIAQDNIVQDIPKRIVV